MTATLGKLSSWLLSALAGLAAFLLTLGGFVLLSRLDQQIAASLLIGAFALLVVWVAAEKPNSGHARAVAALIDRLLAVGRGDLSSPAPDAVRQNMPALAAAVDGLFEQVRSNLDNVNAMAMYDPVTTLPNRVYFRREGDRMLRARPLRCSSALLFIDLDGFKEVNDRLGHAQGDQVLMMVANRLRAVVKGETEPGSLLPPLLARLAGDEFTILLPAVHGREEAERVADRALAALSVPFRTGDHTPCLGASIGIALCPDHAPDLTALMKAADIAMYHAKANGRSQACIYDSELAQACAARADAEVRLRRALEEDQLELVYQPQLCLRSGAILGGEALIRWNGSSGDIGVTEEVFGVAEETGLTLEVNDWALRTASRSLGRWRAEGLAQRMCLKINPKQLERRDFFARLRDSLAEAGPPPWPVEIELPETMLGHCDEQTVAEIDALRREGLTVAISDFGSGQAGFARLSELAVDRVKLHESLVREIDKSDRARTIVSALIHMIHGLGCEAVASGVERQDQLEVLRAIGCDRVRGFFCAEPMAEDTFVSWVAAQNCAESLARAS